MPLRSVLLWLCVLSVPLVSSQDVASILPKNSLQPPYGDQLPGWRYGGSAAVAGYFLRLSSNANQRAWLINDEPLQTTDPFEIRFSFSVLPGVKGDVRTPQGLALWLTQEQIHESGPVYGGPSSWKGVAIALETSDGHGQEQYPHSISAFLNDGSKTFDVADQNLASFSCATNFRLTNSENKRGEIRVVYQNSILSVGYDLTSTSSHWVDCFTIPIDLGSQIKLALTGSTPLDSGDYQDVVYLSTTSLKPLDNQQQKDANVPTIDIIEEQVGEAPPPPPLPPPPPPPPQRTPQTPPRSSSPSATQPSPAPRSTSQGPVQLSLGHPQILKQLEECEQRHEALGTKLDSSIRTLSDKLAKLEADSAVKVSALQQSSENIRRRADESSTLEIRNNLKSMLQTLQKIEAEMGRLQTNLDGTYQQTLGLQRLSETHAQRLADIVESKYSWGFWAAILVFQILFCGVFVYYQNSKSKDRSGWSSGI